MVSKATEPRPDAEPRSADTSLDVAIEEIGGWKRRLTISVAPEKVARTRASERKKLTKSLRLKGFRKGHVPAEVVEKRFGDEVDQRAVQSLLGEAYGAAIREHGLTPLGDPHVGEVQYRSGESLTFQVELEVMPTITLARTSDFRIARPKVAVEDREVEELLAHLREEHATWEPLDGSPAEGHQVSIRVSPANDSGSGPAEEPKPYRFILGDGSAIPGVEEAIRTLTPGEARSFDVTFPAEGEREESIRHLWIELVGAGEKRLPDLDDDFAAEMGDFDSLDELRAALRRDLLAHHEREAEAAVDDHLLDAVAEANPLEIPDTMVNATLERMIPQSEVRGEEMASLRESLVPMARKQVQRQLIIERLIERENLEATPEELDAKVTELAKRAGEDSGTFRRKLRKEGGLRSLAHQVAADKALAYLRSRSTVE